MRYLIILSLLILQACATNSPLRLYQGPELADEQEVTLVLPVEFEIVKLDQEEVSQFKQLFRNQDLIIKLAPGPHTLVLIYSDIWQIDSDNHENLTSGHLTFSGELLAGQTYRLQTPALNTHAQAKAFVSAPQLQLVSEQQNIPASVSKKANPLVFGKDEKTQHVDYPNLKQLKFWWSNANQYERQSFQQWIQQPE